MRKTHLNLHITLMAIAGLVSASAFAASRPYNDYISDTAIREMRSSIDDIRHISNNHETEIQAIEEKFTNLETIIDSLRKQITDQVQGSKELLKNSTTSFEAKLGDLDLAMKGLTADLRQIKNHANDSTTVLTQYKKRISDLEKTVEAQNQNMENLQSALKSMMDAMQIKDGLKDSTVGSSRIYQVKAGDTLDKIALANQTTIKAIKELNSLTNDRIIVGQKLQLPEK